MSLRAVVDNDVLLKGSCYGLLAQMAQVIPADWNELGFLGAAPFVVRKKISTANSSGSNAVCIRYVNYAFSKMASLEPTEAEMSLAAEIEMLAQELNFPLDFGESQLCSIAITRKIEWLVTGDKRAIRSLEALVSARDQLGHIRGKAICLEQLLFLLVCFRNTRARYKVCSEPSIDRALSIAFSCALTEAPVRSWLQGLRSYIESLRANAPTVLSAI